MNNRAFIVSEKGFPERLCLFYVDDEQPHPDETIKLVIGNIYPLIDKAMLAKYTNIVRISSIEQNTQKTVIFTNVRNAPRKDQERKQITTTKYTTVFSLGLLGEEIQRRELIDCNDNDNLIYCLYDNVNAINDSTPAEMTAPVEPIQLNAGNRANNSAEFFQRLALDPTWETYFNQGSIPQSEQTNETISAYCLAEHPGLKKLADLKQNLHTITPDTHRNALAERINTLEQQLKEWVAKTIGETDITSDTDSLNTAVNDAFNQLNIQINQINYGDKIAQLAYAKSLLIYHLQKAAAAYADYAANHTIDQELPVLDQFMATAKHLDDNFHGIAYLDGHMHYQTCDLSTFTLSQLMTLINITLKPKRNKTRPPNEQAPKQDTNAYKELVKELQQLKAPFTLKMPKFWQPLKSAKLELEESHKRLEPLVEEQQRLINEKRGALVEALAARENYPQTVLQKHLDSLSSENKKTIEKQLKTIEKHASERYCQYQKKVEALKAAKNAVVQQITQHAEQMATPIPLALPEGDVQHEELTNIAAKYVAEANQIIEQTKTNLDTLKAKIPTRFNAKTVDQTILTVNTYQEEATRLIDDEARQLESLKTAYQKQIAEKVSALEKIAEEARKAQAAEEARRQEEAAAKLEAERERQNAEEAARLEREEAGEAARLRAVQETEEKPTTRVANVGHATPSTPTSPETMIPAFRSLIVEEISSDVEITIISPKRSKKQVAVMAAAVTGSILAGVGVTFLCALTLPASLPIIVAIAIGAATSLLIGAPSITATYCCLFKPNTHPGRNENALQPSLPRQS